MTFSMECSIDLITQMPLIGHSFIYCTQLSASVHTNIALNFGRTSASSIVHTIFILRVCFVRFSLRRHTHVILYSTISFTTFVSYTILRLRIEVKWTTIQAANLFKVRVRQSHSILISSFSLLLLLSSSSDWLELRISVIRMRFQGKFIEFIHLSSSDEWREQFYFCSYVFRFDFIWLSWIEKQQQNIPFWEANDSRSVS